MNKTWAEIKSEVINLGFEKQKTFDKNKMSFIQAFNWAQNFITSTVCPLEDSVMIQKQKSKDSYVKYDLFEITKQAEQEVFLSFSNKLPILHRQNEYKTITDFILQKDRYILFKGELEGEIEIFFNKYPLPIDLDTQDVYPVEIPYQYANLLPYLMAHRLWLDDDSAKAVHYWNLYDDMKTQIEDKKVTVTVVNDRWVI